MQDGLERSELCGVRLVVILEGIVPFVCDGGLFLQGSAGTIR